MNIDKQRALGSGSITTLFSTRDSRWRLHIIRCVSRFKGGAPNVGPQFGERESRVALHDFFAELRAGSPRPARAEIEVINAAADRFREIFALGGLGDPEVGREVHAPMIDHFDLLEQIFLHVDQND